MKKIVIAIDGHSSCGKSTMAKALARKIGYVYIDSGAMYRAATLFALREGMIRDGKVDEDALRRRLDDIHIDFHLNAEGIPETYLNGENVERQIRTMEVSNAVSPVSAIPFVRKAMVAQQQAMGERKGIVMDGRDIGTTVFPNAELKIFVTASPEVRAQRRVDELRAKGETVSLEEVLANVRTRDHIDQTRAESPLRQADDALLLDNSHLTLAEQDAWLLNAFNNAAHE
jgi:cytidylate kinase